MLKNLQTHKICSYSLQNQHNFQPPIFYFLYKTGTESTFFYHNSTNPLTSIYHNCSYFKQTFKFSVSDIYFRILQEFPEGGGHRVRKLLWRHQMVDCSRDCYARYMRLRRLPGKFQTFLSLEIPHLHVSGSIYRDLSRFLWKRK